MNGLLVVSLGAGGVMLGMALLWIVQRRTGDAGIVDVAWGMGVAALTVLYAATSDEGNGPRRILVATLTLLWALRLSGYVLVRLMTMPADGRYEAMKSKWGNAASWRMFVFYQFQALACLLFSLPMLVCVLNPMGLGWHDVVACVIWLVAVTGESVADWQLSRFRANSANAKQVCRSGLWRYSRHPNYFFEWLHWWSYVAFAYGAPYDWLTVFAPLLMFYFITRVTGIPPTEAQALKSRGERYREYQRQTSPFFPWPPRGAR